jgi:DnaJ-class molecular chaperone
MDIKRCYEVLGVKPDCSDSELKAAYRRLAKEFHPDVNQSPEAEGNFKLVQNAYEEITKYRGGGFVDPFNSMFGFRRHNIDNIWETFFRSGARMNMPNNVRIELEFDKLSQEDSEKLLQAVKDAGFDFVRYSIIRGA